MSDVNARIQAILDEFEPYDRIYKRQAMEEAVALKEEITPHLIKILEDAQADPTTYFESMSHTYAFILLGYFKESRAHKPIVDLFSLPKPLIEPLFGDTITEDLSTVLFHTCGGSVDDIKQLILNKQAYEYCRSAAIDALMYATVAGYVPREETLEFFGGLFTGEEAKEDDVFWGSIVSSLGDLHATEMMPVIKKAFDDELIDLFYIDLKFIEETFEEEDQAKAYERVREEVARRSPDDIHKYMAWWALFDIEDGRQPAFSAPGLPEPKSAVDQKAKKAKKKRKRKLAKASKKKNRRK